MLTIDISLDLGTAEARIEDADGTAIAAAAALTETPMRFVLEAGQSLYLTGNGADPYRILAIHSGSADSGNLVVGSDQGKYVLVPAASARLGSSVVIETAAGISVAPPKSDSGEQSQ